MSKYDTNNAMYEYANGVLKNKLNIKDHSELEIAEQEIVSLKQGRFDLKIKNFNLEDLCSIHQYLFNTIFTWAGELRKVDISKGNTRFANFEHIVSS
jgi:cell filamentation protein